MTEHAVDDAYQSLPTPTCGRITGHALNRDDVLRRALTEVYGFRRYTQPRDIATLLFYGVVENALYRQWKALVSWRGFVQFLRGDTSWGEMTRVGLEK